MNDIFNFRRFGRYFLHETRHIFARRGTGLLTIGLMPVFIFAFSIAFFVFGDGYSYMSIETRQTIASFILLLFILTVPSSCYGFVTGRMAGPVYTLTPVSVVEKFTSMILNAVVVLPLLTGMLYLISDMLTTMIAGQGFDKTMLCSVFSMQGFRNIPDAHIPILAFLLGAVWFKKNKAAKTALVIIGILIALSFIGLSWIKEAAVSAAAIPEMDSKVYEAILLATDIAVSLLLAAAIFLRIKKIQY